MRMKQAQQALDRFAFDGVLSGASDRGGETESVVSGGGADGGAGGARGEG